MQDIQQINLIYSPKIQLAIRMSKKEYVYVSRISSGFHGNSHRVYIFDYRNLDHFLVVKSVFKICSDQSTLHENFHVQFSFSYRQLENCS